MSSGDAFGRPGIAPTWSSSAKDLVITSLGPSRLWATLGHGIVNEVYWPATGLPQIRDLGFIVAGGGRWTEVKRDDRYALTTPEPWMPLPRVVHEGEGYRLTCEFLPDPSRDVLLISYRLEGEGLRLYPLLAPHLSRSGTNNTAWVDGADLYARREDRSLCLASSPPFRRGSADRADAARRGPPPAAVDRAVLAPGHAACPSRRPARAAHPGARRADSAA